MNMYVDVDENAGYGEQISGTAIPFILRSAVKE